MYFGDFKLGRPVHIPFNTFDSNDPQASVTITNLANTDIHIHKDDGTTQRNNAAGVTVNINFDSITGNHLVVIDTSDETVNSFWQVGHDYQVRMEGTTVDAGTINAWIGAFSIENRYNPSALTPEYSVTTDWEQNEQNKLSGPAHAHLMDDRGYGVIHHWELDELQNPIYVSTDNPRQSVDIKSISRDEDSSDNLELQYDTTGLTGNTYPATQAQIGNISAGSAAISIVAESYTLTTGTQSSGTITDAETRNDTRHEHTDTAGAMELYYQFDVTGNGTAVEVFMEGYLAGGNDSLDVFAYDWVGAGWDQIGTLSGGAAADADYTYNLLTRHTGTGANLGKVRIRFYAASGLTSATLAIDQITCSYTVVSQSVGYEGGAVWLDTGASNTNTESFVDGVADNPVSTIAAARTIASNVGLNKYHISNDSTLTLGASSVDEEYEGTGWTLALGGQDISGSTFTGANAVSGTSTSPTGETHFQECEFSNTTVGNSHFKRCGFDGTLTLAAATDYFLIDCYSQVAGASAPTLDMGAAVGASNVSLRRWSGGITINNLASGDVVSLDGIFGTITLNGADATVEIRGIAKAVTNNLTGSPTVNDDSIKADDIASILADTNELQGDWANGGRLDLLIDQILADTNELQSDDVPGLIAALNDLSAAAVNAEVVDALATDTYAEPGQATPAATASLAAKINYLYKAWRNKKDNDGTTTNLYADDGTTVDQKQSTSESGGTVTKGEWATGP